jgi:hypothetical protein
LRSIYASDATSRLAHLRHPLYAALTRRRLSEESANGFRVQLRFFDKWEVSAAVEHNQPRVGERVRSGKTSSLEAVRSRHEEDRLTTPGVVNGQPSCIDRVCVSMNETTGSHERGADQGAVMREA